MLPLIKRVQTNYVIAILTALLVIYLVVTVLSTTAIYSGLAGSGGNSRICPQVSPDHPYVSTNPAALRWKEIPLRYPVSSLTHLPTDGPTQLSSIQAAPKPESEDSKRIRIVRRDAVKASFQRVWKMYRERAWMKDELEPISGGSNDRFGGWGATLVDSLDTLWIMRLDEEFKEAVNAAITIEFGNPDKIKPETISVFETTIRYLGGLLSAYDLAGCADKRLLDKAVELGNMLYVAFDTPLRAPIIDWNPHTAIKGELQEPHENDNNLACLGSLTMEFTRLSQLTGDMRYYDAIQRVSDLLRDRQSKTKLPGMWPQFYVRKTMDFSQGTSFSLGGNSDSTYEYLLKMYVLLGGAGTPAKQYLEMYQQVIKTASEHLFFRPRAPGNPDILVSGRSVTDENNKPTLTPEGEHLTCFVGGMVALGGQVLRDPAHVEMGRKLTEGCAWAYQISPTGIVSETYGLIPCANPSSCEWDESFWNETQSPPPLPKGVTKSGDRSYSLRPEAIESVFYMYRITGDPKYQDMGWKMFQAIDKHTRTEYGNARLADVYREDGPKDNVMESFWLAETLKYFYLLFSEQDLISLDDFVFSTEAHPFRISKPE